eukprot:tig00000385_g24736.t1
MSGQPTSAAAAAAEEDALRDVSLEKIMRAKRALQGVVHETELVPSASLSKMAGCSVFLKLENLQKTGSFKARGAYMKIKSLSEEEKGKGVIAAHAQGVAWAATAAGIKSTIVMPEASPLAKVQATRSYGAEVVLHGPTFEDAFARALELQRERDLTFIHPFNDVEVIAGQGTIGVEICQVVPDADAVVVAVGGGGLLAGVAVAVRALNPRCRIFGVQAEKCAPMAESKRARSLCVSRGAGATIADGIAVRPAGAGAGAPPRLDISPPLLELAPGSGSLATHAPPPRPPPRASPCLPPLEDLDRPAPLTPLPPPFPDDEGRGRGARGQVKQPGSRTFRIIDSLVDEIVLIDDESIAAAMLVLLERCKTMVEAAGAAPLAALLQRRIPDIEPHHKVACVLCGGNVDVNFLSRVIERGMVKAGRRVRVTAVVPDRPGALSRLLALVAAARGNVHEVHHDRADRRVHLGEASVDITIETRDWGHGEEIVKSLREGGFHVGLQPMAAVCGELEAGPGAPDGAGCIGFGL